MYRPKKQNYRKLRELPTTLNFRSHVTLVSATVRETFKTFVTSGRASHMSNSRIFLSTDALIIEWDMIDSRGGAGLLSLGSLNLYHEETCMGLPYLFELLNLFTFIYLLHSDHRGR